MKINELKTFVKELCADDYSNLCSLLNLYGESIVGSKTSNHQIIKRERTKDSKLKCPLCGSTNTVKNGHTKTNRQKYICRGCESNFSDTTNTIAFHSRKSYHEWSAFIADTLDLKPLRKTAAMLDISTTTAFAWRHKLLTTFSTYKKDDTGNLSSKIEADGMYFTINLKGTKECNMPRYSKRNGNGSSKRGTSNHKVCVLTALDDKDNSLIEITGLGPESIEKLIVFKERFDENSLLITDSKAAFIEFASSRKMDLDQIPSGFKTSNRGNNISTINGLHSQIRLFLSPFKGVSTKHLQGYLDMFRFYKELRYTTEYKEMNNLTYCYSISDYKKMLIKDIYNKKMPVDLKKAYGEYKYGIYKEVA
jgi:transposase-like protein